MNLNVRVPTSRNVWLWLCLQHEIEAINFFHKIKKHVNW